MRVSDTDLAGIRLIVLDAFEDHRGVYLELHDTEKYREIGIDIEFVQDDISVSHRNVLRGLHGDWETTKLVTVVHGEGYAILADNRPDSPTHHQWQGFALSHHNRHQLLIPPGIGNSIVALSDRLVYHYKQSTHYVPHRQFTIHWNDPDWGFAWPIADPILSARDAKGRHVEC